MCLLKPPCFRDRALTSVIDGGVRGAEDQGDGCTHVQLRQCQLVHEIWELMERNHTGMVTAAWHPLWGWGSPGCCDAPASHLDLAQLLLDLAGHLLGPVLLPEEVPEDAPHQRVHPGHARLAAPGRVLAELRRNRSHEPLERGGPRSGGLSWMGAPLHHSLAAQTVVPGGRRRTTALELAARSVRQPPLSTRVPLPVLDLSHSPLWVWGCPVLHEGGSGPGCSPPALAQIGPCRCCNPRKSVGRFPPGPWMGQRRGCPRCSLRCCCRCSAELVPRLGT